MTDRPRVTIVIPVYNGSNYLADAIESALGQTYDNTEIIVVNDGSEDAGRTEAIAKSFGSQIRYIRKPNGGTATALNAAVENMAGEYLSWLSHDDLYHPTKVAAQVEILTRSANPDTVVYSGYEEINENGEALGTFVDPDGHQDIVLAIFDTVIHGCTLLIPKRCFDAVGLFDPAAKSTQDNEMWLRIALEGFPFHYMGRSLVQSRQHPEQGSRTIGSHHTERKKWYLWAVDTVEAALLAPRARHIAKIVVAKRHTPVAFNLFFRLLKAKEFGAAASLAAYLPQLLLLRTRILLAGSPAGAWLKRRVRGFTTNRSADPNAAA